MEDMKSVVLDCGCECEFIGERVFWVYCEDHEEDSCPTMQQPYIKKYRKSVEDYA